MTTTGKPTRQEQQPASEEVVEVAPDILRMQLPIALPGLGHVNTYALCDDRGIAVVDPGLPGKQSWDALVSRLDQAGYRVKDVHTVIVTHSHPDHFGGAGLLRHRSGAEVVTHRAFRTWMDPDEGDDVGPDDLPTVDDPSDLDGPVDRTDGPDDPANRGRARWKLQQPWSGDTFKPPLGHRMKFRMMRTIGRRWVKPPQPSRRLGQDDVVGFAGREWVAVHTPGHTNDHLCLYSPTDGVVLAGDHVLPTITPHISGLVAGEDPLAQFFASLDRIASLDHLSLALPAHGLEFSDVAGRCEAIKTHHDERLQKLRDASAALGETSVVELSHQLFQKRSWGRMAESETYAHLEHLRFAGEMTSRRVGEDLHYSMVPEPPEERAAASAG
ncbi:MAG: MBL fold metallo-hydrolase [Acidimicrobiales bacterium]|nr:MBL fold metallo-hydrolase [Acidimicrobiales bacterium]